MATRVFLLCADEKAIEAVSQVLDELEVSFEHSSDASLAVKRLSSQSYEAVVVDCDNEQRASQIFNTLKSSSANQVAITIAIVDGKEGLPNAFRLGASLVLTKPVSLEQARGTIRNAIAMRRKTAPESKTMAATAAQGTTVDAIASHVPAASKVIVNPSPTAVPEIPRPTTKIVPAQTHAAPVPPASAAAPAKAPVPDPASAPVTPKRTPFSKAQSSSQLTEQLTAFKPAPAKPRTPEGEPATSHDRTSHAHSSAPTFGMLDKKESRKTGSGLLAVLTLLLAGGGFYAAWTMVPGFSTAVMSQYNSLYARITGAAAPSQAVIPAPVQPRPAVKPQVTAAAAASSQNAANPAPAASTPATSPVPDGFAPTPAAPSEGFATDAAAKSPTTPSNSASAATSENDTPVEVDEEAADAHVAYRVRPVYPEAARRKLAKGEVVVLTVVNTDGTVGSAKVKSGNPIFGAAAIAAVKQWRYQTYYQDGQPASFQTVVTLKFVPPGRR